MKTFGFGFLVTAILLAALSAPAASSVRAPFSNVKSKAQYKRLKSQLWSKAGETRVWWRWQVAKWAIVYDEERFAVEQLKILLKAKQSIVPHDQIHLTLGRALYQQGRLQEAIEHYESVPKSSDFWLESVEEVAWAYLRQGKEAQTLAELKTLLSPVFDRQVGAEPYYLAALTHFKVCDYPGVFKVTDQFKKRYIGKIKALQSLRDNGTNTAAQKLFGEAEKGKLTYNRLAHGTLSLPQFFFRDYYVLRQLKDIKANRVGAKARAQRRLTQLARRDLREVEKTLSRLHLIEAEVIQRIHQDQKLNKKKPEVNLAKNGDVLVFPVTDKEVWLDELDNYRVGVRNCPTNLIGAM